MIVVTNIANDRGPNPSQSTQNAGSFDSKIYGPDGTLIAWIDQFVLPVNNTNNGSYPAIDVEADYGMSNRSHRMGADDPAKVLMLDYSLIVASVVGPDYVGIYWDEVAPRHLGTINVLYVGGHVRNTTPNAIDPNVTALHDEFWRPSRE